jgi:hypothetical protein
MCRVVAGVQRPLVGLFCLIVHFNSFARKEIKRYRSQQIICTWISVPGRPPVVPRQLALRHISASTPPSTHMPRGRPARRTNESEEKLDKDQQTLKDIASWPLPPLKAVPVSIRVESEVPASADSEFCLVVTHDR